MWMYRCKKVFTLICSFIKKPIFIYFNHTNKYTESLYYLSTARGTKNVVLNRLIYALNITEMHILISHTHTYIFGFMLLSGIINSWPKKRSKQWIHSMLFCFCNLKWCRAQIVHYNKIMKMWQVNSFVMSMGVELRFLNLIFINTNYVCEKENWFLNLMYEFLINDLIMWKREDIRAPSNYHKYIK